MSIVANFANDISSNFGFEQREVNAIKNYPARVDKIHEIKAVIFDIYGTLVNYWKDEFVDTSNKEVYLLVPFKKCVDYFEMRETLVEMNPVNSPEVTLRDFYHGLIALQKEKVSVNSEDAEIKTENVWKIIIMMLQRHGYKIDDLQLGGIDDIAKCIAFFYNYHSLGRGFYKGVSSALKALNNENIKLGLFSNAQFYTPMDLTLFLREQSNNEFDDYLELFDRDLVIYSYEYGVLRPNQILYRRLFDSLYELDILPQETLFVGNDLITDIQCASEIGLKTALFTGDENSLFQHNKKGEIVPDIAFSNWEDLPNKISFFKPKK